MTTIFENGRFFTGSESDFASCMVIEHEQIMFVGSNEDLAVKQARKDKAAVFNMQNRLVLPGFIDGHMHLLLLGQSLTKLSLETCKNLDDIRATIKSYAAANPALERILCRGWMHSMTGGLALASMIDDLDERPIFIDSKDLHSTWCNSVALRDLGVGNMADPAGGQIYRDEHGRPSGLMSEAATQMIIWPYLAKRATHSEKLDALHLAVKSYTMNGYTGIIEMAMDEDAWGPLGDLRSKVDVPLRVAAHWLIKPSATEEENLKQVDRAVELHKQFNLENSPDYRIAGIKVITDGVIDACTAALREPYSSNGSSPDPLWSSEQLQPVVKRAHSAGLQVALHAIGDQAIKLAIDTLSTVCQGEKGRRHRIEHLELASPEDAKRVGELGITASIQPVHADPAILLAWPNLLGEHRCSRAFAYQEFLSGGATLAVGTDSPTAPQEFLSNLYVATTRKSAREPESEMTVNKHFALSLASAVTAGTKGAAYSCFADGRTGGLRKGLKADFVVLDVEWAPERLLKGRVRETWFGGRKVFDVESV